MQIILVWDMTPVVWYIFTGVSGELSHSVFKVEGFFGMLVNGPPECTLPHSKRQ
jgi:hypothetical protein